MKQLIFTLFMLASLQTGYSQDTIRVPFEHAIIQAAIDAALNGDIILVSEGIYFENIDFKGKAITVASYFLIDKDTSHISKTIIDGKKNDSLSNSIISFDSNEGQDSRFIGFTVTNGNTGIYCSASNPTLEYLIIKNNRGKNSASSGSGIRLYGTTSLKLSNLIIYNNSAVYEGGGILCRGATVLIENSTISNNSAYEGGGIRGDYYSLVNLKNCIIKENTATYGGGIYCPYEVIFDPNERNSIFSNNAGIGKDLYKFFDSPDINVILDTFTVLQPSEDLASPISKFNFDILNGKIDLIDSDLFVSPDGSDQNNGLSAYTPLKTIRKAILIIASNSNNPKTINLLNGIYSLSSNGETFPIAAKPYVNFTGQSQNGVIIDANGQNSVIICENDAIINFKNLTIKGAGIYEYSSGIKCSNTLINVENVTITENKGSYSSGIFCINNSKVYLKNCDIINNQNSGIRCYSWYGAPSILSLNNVNVSGNKSEGGIHIESIMNLEIDSCNIVENEGGGILFYGSNAEIRNTTITHNKGTGIISHGNVSIYNSKICNNDKFSDNYTYSSGGGIITGGEMTLSNVTISNNKSSELGGGIHISSWGILTFSSDKRCNIYSNSAPQGNDIFSDSENIINVIVDTFTVISPTEYFCMPLNKFSFDVLNSKVEQVNGDLFVSSAGDNSNSGLSADKPLLNISFALSKIFVDSLNPHSIYLDDGIYSPSNNQEFFPIVVPSYTSIIGSSIENTILDIEAEGGEGWDLWNSVTNPNGILISYKKDIELKNLTITGSNGINRAFKCDYSDSINIQNVLVYKNLSGGMEFNSSSSKLKNVIFNENGVSDIPGWGFIAIGQGGGINSSSSDLILEDVSFIDNTATNGAGINCQESNVLLNNVIIENNEARNGDGGGIRIEDNSSIDFHNTTIRNNIAKSGGGLSIQNGFNTSLNFSSQYRSNIYFNSAAKGSDIYYNNLFSDEFNVFNVVLDTFTVLNPSSFHISPSKYFTYDILNSKIDQVHADLYVSPNGDNLNSGLNKYEPIKSITVALMKIIADEENQHTIFLDNGMYSPSTTADVFPLNMPSFVSIKGSSKLGSVLNAEGSGSVICFDHQQGSSLAKLTLTGGFAHDGGGIHCNNSSPTINDLLIYNNTATGSYDSFEGWPRPGYGGGIYCVYNSNPLIKNVVLGTNKAMQGGGIAINYSYPVIYNIELIDNIGGGIYCQGSEINFQNVKIQKNKEEHNREYESNPAIYSTASKSIFSNIIVSGYSSDLDGIIYHSYSSDDVFINLTATKNSGNKSGFFLYGSKLTLINSILWNNFNELIKSYDDYYSTFTVAFSNINVMKDSIKTNQWLTLSWLDGNINSNPLFINSAEDDYYLSSNSPCIGTGIDSIIIGGKWLVSPSVDILGHPRPDPIGSKPDMGAYESQLSTDILLDEILPQIFSLSQNYPNPFNSKSIIKYSIPHSSKVIIKVFDILGSEVVSLVNEEKDAGYHSIDFDGSYLPSGVYFYQLRAERFIETKKVLLLK